MGNTAEIPRGPYIQDPWLANGEKRGAWAACRAEHEALVFQGPGWHLDARDLSQAAKSFLLRELYLFLQLSSADRSSTPSTAAPSTVYTSIVFQAPLSP
jgi:hypothetical protein